MKGCWYEFWMTECVYCGKSESGRFRRLTPRPEDPHDRYRFEQTFCQGHLL